MLADQFDVFLLDLDGVLYVGDEPVPDSIDAAKRLLNQGKAIRILTNNPRLSRATLASRVASDGLDLPPSDIITSGWAAARFLRQKGVKQVDVIGSEGAQAACTAEGIALTTETPNAVIVGADPTVTYLDLQRAMNHIRNGARFVGTNPDTSFPTPSGRGLGAGALIQALEAATGVSATIAGKPEPLMFEVIRNAFDSSTRMVMIGDNPQTDIQGARRAGLPSILLADATPDAGDDAPAADLVLATLTSLFDPGLTIG